MKLNTVFYWHSYNILIFLEIASVVLVVALTEEEHSANQTLLQDLDNDSAEAQFGIDSTLEYKNISAIPVISMSNFSLKRTSSFITQQSPSNSALIYKDTEKSEEDSVLEEISPKPTVTSASSFGEFQLNTITELLQNEFLDSSDLILRISSKGIETPFLATSVSSNFLLSDTTSIDTWQYIHSDKDKFLSNAVHLHLPQAPALNAVSSLEVSSFASSTNQLLATDYSSKGTDSSQQSYWFDSQPHSYLKTLENSLVIELNESSSDSYYKMVTPSSHYFISNSFSFLEEFDTSYLHQNEGSSSKINGNISSDSGFQNLLTSYELERNDSLQITTVPIQLLHSLSPNLSVKMDQTVISLNFMGTSVDLRHGPLEITANLIDTVSLAIDDNSGNLFASEINESTLLFKEISNWERTDRQMLYYDETNNNFDLTTSFQSTTSNTLLFFDTDFNHKPTLSSVEYFQNLRTSMFNSQQTLWKLSRANQISSDIANYVLNNFDERTGNESKSEHFSQYSIVQPTITLSKINVNDDYELDSETLKSKLMNNYSESFNGGNQNGLVYLNKSSNSFSTYDLSSLNVKVSNLSEKTQENSQLVDILLNPFNTSHISNHHLQESHSSSLVSLNIILSHTFSKDPVNQMTEKFRHLNTLSLQSSLILDFSYNSREINTPFMDSGDADGRKQYNRNIKDDSLIYTFYIDDSTNDTNINYYETLHPTPVQSNETFKLFVNELLERWSFVSLSSSIQTSLQNISRPHKRTGIHYSVSTASRDIVKDVNQSSITFKLSSDGYNSTTLETFYPEIQTTSAPSNYTKDLRRILKKSKYPLGHFNLSLGVLSRIPIPKDMSRTPLRLTLLQGNGLPVPPNYWLQVTESGDLLSLPVQQSYVGVIWKFTLRSMNNENETIEDNFSISLNSSLRLNKTHEISMKLNCSFMEFSSNIQTMSLFLERLANFFGYNNTDDIIIIKIESSVVNVKWTNMRLSKCNTTSINQQFNRIASPDGTPNIDFVRALGNEFPVISVNCSIDSACNLKNSRKSYFSKTEALAVILPFLGIVFGIIFITACCTVSKRCQPKQKVHIKNIDIPSEYYLKAREPIILKDERFTDTKNLKPKLAILLNSDELSDNSELACAEFFSPSSFHSEEHLQSSKL